MCTSTACCVPYWKGPGCICRPAFSGSEALLWAEKYDYDLLLLDLMLPGATGEEFIAQVRRGKTMPIIIVLSAKVAVEDRGKRPAPGGG